jgi:hypothetical protein
MISIFLVSYGFSQNFFPILGGQRAGTSIFTFLKIGVSAHALGMGEAVVALNQDAASVYYNPATIAQFKEIQFSTTHIELPAEIKFDYFSMNRNIYGRHYLGISAGILHMAPMMETTEYLPHGTGNYFVFQDRFFALTYGARMTDRFSFGITLKHVQEDLAGNKMSAPMLDMGTFYWTGFKTLRFSASISHFGSQAKPEGKYLKNVLDTDTGEETIIETEFEEFSPPTVFRVGAAMDIYSFSGSTLIAAIQLNHPVDDAENIALGAEYLFLKMLSIRGGYKINKSEEDFSFGAGVKVPVGGIHLTVDYSYSFHGHLTNPTWLTIGFSL